MTPDEYRQATNLFDQVRDLPESERASALDAGCAGNAALHAQVLRLLDADRAASGGKFLEKRAIDDAARRLAAEAATLPPAGSTQQNRTGALSPGMRLGPYEITASLGAGGMGEVYRAHDSKLNRDVAIKVLPAALANDAQYMARFEREAQLLALVNHPNIATVYGVEQGALVMELVDGADLRGPLPLDEAIPIARQIAIGLEAAHERGIVHRDLKPANIKITSAGVVKLLDFGLAKSPVDAGSTAVGLAISPSPSPIALTEAGMILGTAAYMSPEQARGKNVDKRADIWSFGVVLYELLTGQRLFGRETVTDTLAAVVKDAPDLDTLPSDTPPRIRRLLVRCLRKDVQTRLRDIGEARVVLDEPDEIPAPVRPRRVARVWMTAVTVVTAAALGVLLLRRPAEDTRTLRLFVPPPVKANFSAASVPAVSPDGGHVAFAAEIGGKPQLWIRDLNALSAKPVPDTEGAFDPFWSPDSQSVGFFVPGKLKTVAIDGGPAIALCDAPDGRGGSWSPNGTIVFTPTYGAPLARVASSGGAVTALTSLQESSGETSHRFPWFLPDGRHFLFTVRSGSPEKTAIYAGDLESKDRRLVVAAASNAVYTPPGLLLFMRRSTLMAQPFDASNLKTTGDAFPVADQVDYVQGNVQGQFSASQTGVLAYYSGGGSLQSQLTWFSRSGTPLGTVGPPGVMQAPAISPDGGTVAVDRLDATLGTYDLWLHDLGQGTDSRFTFDSGNDVFPVWSPDGSRLLFGSNRGGKYGLYQKLVTGVGQGELLYETGGVTLPSDWSPDGHSVVFYNTATKTGNDIWVLPLTGDRKAAPFLQTGFSELQGRLSPDGHLLAYESNETGTPNIFVVTFPGAEGKWQISSAGGTRPVWGRDGKELFYISGDSKVTAVDVKIGAKFEYGAPKPLFAARMPPTGLFDVSRDGKRFLVLNGAEPEANAPMTVVTNWSAGLRR
jgi:Tol biopolymer transport system component